MAMKLGIIGAENSHTAAIAAVINIDKSVRGFAVTHVWGETEAAAKAAAEKGRIPTIVKKPTDMLGEIDCVMCDHRDGKYHIPSVLPFLKAGIPVFVDKPMTTSLAQARAFLRKRKELGVPVTTMSAVPLYPSVAEFRKKIKSMGPLHVLHLAGPGDYKSQYGGIWFYGIHQVDLMVELLGTAPRTAEFIVNQKCSTAVITYPDDITVTLNFSHPPERTCAQGFTMYAVCREGTLAEPAATPDSPYVASTRLFTRMFKTGKEPFSDARMLAPIAVLEALEKSLKTGKRVKVSAVG